MSLIFLLLTLSLVILNLTAMGLVAGRLIGHNGLARFTGIMVVTVLLFFVEHFHGLGYLTALWPLSTALSIYLIYRYRQHLVKKIDCELIFAIGFIYALVWRFFFPDVSSTGESITNLSFIASYHGGGTLPPIDHWLPPYNFDYYYSLQHYAAALAGRVLGLSPGYSYNLGMAIATGLIAELCYSTTKSLGAYPLWRLLVVVTVLMGGTGVAPLQSSLWSANHNDSAFDARMSLWHNTRFIGQYDQHVNTVFGNRLLGNAPTGEQTVELPLETIGYLTLQGDYHAPIGGFLLLLFALALIARVSQQPTTQNIREPEFLTALLGLSVSLALAVNIWILPLQGLLVLIWITQRFVTGQRIHLLWLLAGSGAGLILIYPFLSEFALATRSIDVQWVPDFAQTPWPQFLILHWPWIFLSALALTSTRWRALAWALVICLALVMACSEFITLGDNSGRYLRFNTTLKWWSWLHLVTIAGLSAIALTSHLRIIRLATIAILLALCTQAVDLIRFVYHQPKPHAGQLNGYGSIASVHGYSDLLRHLKQAPKGIVLERPLNNRGAYTLNSTLALLSGHAAFIGWPDHLRNWGKTGSIIQQRIDDVEFFYSGKHPQTLRWLQHNNIHYIIWQEANNRYPPHAFERIDQQISKDYSWHEYHSGNHRRTGLWVRRY
ncbi:MAG TPA: DUF2298 domain-containing protein [Cellvibrionaceae bacterium]